MTERGKFTLKASKSAIRRVRLRWLAAVGLAFGACAAAAPVVGGPATARPAAAPVIGGPATARPAGPIASAAKTPITCEAEDPAPRNPANPLDLSPAPGPDPLTGAQFFVYGPAHGPAAGAIAQLLGMNPASLPNDLSWASFWQSIQPKLANNPQLAAKVDDLAKIAAQPAGQRLSNFSMGGGPGALFKQTKKLLCANYDADPGTIPILSTYFLHPALGGCATTHQIKAYGPVFHRRVNEVAKAIGRRRAVMLVETDAIGSSACMAKHGSLGAWEQALRYEINRFGALPHVVTYLEAGYSDGNSVRYTARALDKIGITGIRGFYTNDTHNNWTINEVRWATAISKRTHGAHFIVNTATNGNGPKLNPHPTTQGVEDLCNPPGRALGPQPTTDTGFPAADAWMWTFPPGNSSGHCNGGPASGTFWAARAISLAAAANDRLGPSYPSHPY